MLPLVTVSIPLFRCEDFIVKCLESVRAQTYQNIEVTLINDQTPDRSVEIAESFIQKNYLQNWRIIHLEQNSGLSVVRNKGIETARGTYLFFLDSDDYLKENCIELLVETAERTGAEMTVAQLECEQLKSGEKSICIPLLSNQEVIEGNLSVMKAFADGDLVTYAVNKLMLTEFLRKNELWFVPGLFAQDELWTFHTMLKLNKIALVKELTYTYVLHDKSVIHNRNRRHFDNWATIIEHFTQSLESTKDPQIRNLIRTHIVNYKTMTLVMNWKAKQDAREWLYSFGLYKKYPNLRLKDYFSPRFSTSVKKKSIKLALPPALAVQYFRWMYYR